MFDRKPSTSLIALTITLLSLVGCETRPEIKSTYDKIPFTHSMRMEYNLTPPEIQRLQFYVSHPIQLRHESTTGKYEITKGKLVTKAGQDVNEIIVNRGTPGIAVDVRDSEVRISFEEKFSFRFVRGNGAQSDVYVLAIENNAEGQPIVRYGGASYTPEQNTQLAHLLVSKEELSQIEKIRRVLPGRRIRN